MRATSPPRPKKSFGWGSKVTTEGTSPRALRGFLHVFEKRLMTEVDAVEVADGDRRRTALGERRQTAENVHDLNGLLLIGESSDYTEKFLLPSPEAHAVFGLE